MGGAAGGSPGGQKVLPTSSQSPAYILPGPGSGPVAVRSVWHSPMDGFGSLCPPNESPKSLLLITLSISNSFSPLPTSSSSLSLSLSLAEWRGRRTLRKMRRKRAYLQGQLEEVPIDGIFAGFQAKAATRSSLAMDACSC